MALLNGDKISHRYFSSDEYYQLKDGKIIAEDGVNHTDVFWSEEDGNFREDGWYLIAVLNNIINE